MTELEKIARAIFYASVASGPLVTAQCQSGRRERIRLAKANDLAAWEDAREKCLETARAAVEAMSGELSSAVLTVVGETFPIAMDAAPLMNALHKAMIDAILNEKG